MLIIFDKQTWQINQVVWDDQLPGGVEPGSDEKCLVVSGATDEHRLHKSLIRLGDEGGLAEVRAPVKANVIANKIAGKPGVPILQDILYFEIQADGQDELTFWLELDEVIPAWVNERLQEQNIRVWQAVDGGGEESYVPASGLKDYIVNLKSAQPREWVFSFNNWMIEPVNILVRARQQ